MKACWYEKYGSPSRVLSIKEVSKPVLQGNQVLVKVHYAAVNDYDWSLVRGLPRLYRLLFGVLKPRHNIPGMELSGIIESIGRGVKEFSTGDAVYGDLSADQVFGTFAEYIAVPEHLLRKKPASMGHAAAASLSHAACLAMQALSAGAPIEKGQAILINGAGGGTGMLAMQIAKLSSATVTGVDTGEKLEVMKSIGFDEVIDYKQVDFTSEGQKYHLIIDTKSNRFLSAYSKALLPGGAYVTVGGSLPNLLQLAALGKIFSIFTKKKFAIVSLKPNQDLEKIEEWYAARKIKAHVGKEFSLDDAARALVFFGEARHYGKVLLRM